MASNDDTDCSTVSIDTNATLDSLNNGECNSASKTQRQLAKKQSQLLKKREKENKKKRQSNKISKDDFYNKSLEFKAWLSEKKNLNGDLISPKRSRELFKKFVSKWNGKKLPKHYYRGVDTLWAMGSPLTQSSWAIPGQVDVTPTTPASADALGDKYSRTPGEESMFGTFGKRTGSKLLRKLREYNSKMTAAPDQTVAEIVPPNFDPSNSHIYAEPVSPLKKSHHGNSTSTPSYHHHGSSTIEYAQISELELDNNIPMQDTPEYLGFSRRRRYQSADTQSMFETSSIATIAQPWAAMRSARCLSKYSLVSDGTSANSDTMSMRSLSPSRSVQCVPAMTPCVPHVGSLEVLDGVSCQTNGESEEVDLVKYDEESCAGLREMKGKNASKTDESHLDRGQVGGDEIVHIQAPKQSCQSDLDIGQGERIKHDLDEGHVGGSLNDLGKNISEETGPIKKPKKKKKKKEKEKKSKRSKAPRDLPADEAVYQVPVPVCKSAREAQDDDPVALYANTTSCGLGADVDGSAEKRQRLNKHDSYINKIEHASGAMFETRNIGSSHCVQHTPGKLTHSEVHAKTSVITDTQPPKTLIKPKPPKRTSKLSSCTGPTAGSSEGQGGHGLTGHSPSGQGQTPQVQYTTDIKQSVHSGHPSGEVRGSTERGSSADNSCHVNRKQMVVKTPAGVFLVTKLDGPMDDVPSDVTQSLVEESFNINL